SPPARCIGCTRRRAFPRTTRGRSLLRGTRRRFHLAAASSHPPALALLSSPHSPPAAPRHHRNGGANSRLHAGRPPRQRRGRTARHIMASSSLLSVGWVANKSPCFVGAPPQRLGMCRGLKPLDPTRHPHLLRPGGRRAPRCRPRRSGRISNPPTGPPPA